jgi:hypothetical protein
VPLNDNLNMTPLDTGVSNTIMAYQSIPISGTTGGIPALKFGLGLGKLMRNETQSATVAPAPTDLRYAGFYVLLNAVDRSMWIAIDWFPLDDYLNSEELDADIDDWGRLRGDDRLQIGVMRISQDQWEKTTPLSVASGDPFGVYPAMGCRLEAKPAPLGQLGAAQSALAKTTP